MRRMKKPLRSKIACEFPELAIGFGALQDLLEDLRRDGYRFAAIRRLTQGHGAGVTLIVQLVALVLIVAGLILFVRRRGDD